MFYVSHITGGQSLYTEEVFRAMRETQQAQLEAQQAQLSVLQEVDDIETEQLQAEQLGTFADADESLVEEDDAVAGSVRSDSGFSPSASSAASTAAAGTASSSLHSKERQHDGSITENKFELPEQQRRRKDEKVAETTAAAQVRKQEVEHPGQFKKASRSINPYQKLDQPQPKRERALLASQIMASPVISLSPDDVLLKAKSIFEKHRFRHIPITKDGKLVGILSDRVAHALNNYDHPVSEEMVTPVLSARPHTEIRLIAEVLFKERIGAMPIVDDNGTLVGMLTRSDILRTLINHAPLELWV